MLYDFKTFDFPLTFFTIAAFDFTTFKLSTYFLYLCHMNENLDPTNQNYNHEELDLEKKLRPLSFDDFTGQDQVLEN